MNRLALLLPWFVSNSLFNVASKAAFDREPLASPILLTALQCGVASLGSLLVLALTQRATPRQLLRAVVAPLSDRLIVLGAALTACGCWATNASMQRSSVFLTHVVKSCEPVSTAVALRLLFGKSIAPPQALLLAANVVGAVIVAYGHKRDAPAAGGALLQDHQLGIGALCVLRRGAAWRVAPRRVCLRALIDERERVRSVCARVQRGHEFAKRRAQRREACRQGSWRVRLLFSSTQRTLQLGSKSLVETSSELEESAAFFAHSFLLLLPLVAFEFLVQLAPSDSTSTTSSFGAQVRRRLVDPSFRRALIVVRSCTCFSARRRSLASRTSARGSCCRRSAP